MGLAPSRRSPQQSIADRTTYVGQLAVEVMLQHDERQRLLAIAERSLWKPLAYIGRPTYVSVRTSWLFLLGTPRGYPRNAPLAWSPASSQLLHEGRELGAVHLDGLREAGLHDGSVFAEPVSTSLPLLLLCAVVGQDFAVFLLNRLQFILVFGHIRQQFVDVNLQICPPVVHQSDASMHHSGADVVVFFDGVASF